MLTPSTIKRQSWISYDFSLQDGEAKEHHSKFGNYAVRAVRNGNLVTVYKRFGTKNFKPHTKINYNDYIRELSKPMNHGSLIETF
jgi:hypothetical protein